MLKTDKDANIPTKKIKSLYELYQLTQMINEDNLIDYIVTNTPKYKTKKCQKRLLFLENSCSKI